jgi:integrase
MAALHGGRVLPKNVKAIEAAKAESKRASYSIRGERGLRLLVRPSGRKAWFYVYQVGSGAARKRRWHEIGTFPEYTLAEACAAAAALRAEVEHGGDPEEAKTLDELFQLWLDEHAKKKLRTWRDEEARYDRHLRDDLGDKSYVDIERKDVREIRDEVAGNSGPIESNRVVDLFNRVMNWAVEEDRAKFNPAARLKKTAGARRRERVLNNDELRCLWAELDRPLVIDHDNGGLTERDLEAAIAVRRALKLLLVTGQRRGELIGMRKDELDLTEGNAWWTIPGSRTKNRLPHRVPLTPMALGMVKEAIASSYESEFVFPSGKSATFGLAIRADAVTRQLQRLCKKMTPPIEGLGPHDLRRTVGTEMRKLRISVEDRGYVLNHVSGAKSKVTSWNYDAGEHDVEKRRALETWERELRKILGLEVYRPVKRYRLRKAKFLMQKRILEAVPMQR